MDSDEKLLASALIRALINDWALVEDDEDEERLVLVNESREVMEGLRPKRSFVAWLQSQGFIENRAIPLNAEPQYSEYTRWTPENGVEICSVRDPHVFDFIPTPKGIALLSNESL